MLNSNILYCVTLKRNKAAVEQAVAIFTEGQFTVRYIYLEGHQRVIPHYLMDYVRLEMETNSLDSGCHRFYFLTDNMAFLKLVFRLYQGIFEAFVFFQGQKAVEDYLVLDDIYLRLLREPLRKEENLHKPVYSNCVSASLEGIPVKDTRMLMATSEVIARQDRPSLLYEIGGEYALFDPTGYGMQTISFDTCDPLTKNNPIKPENLLLYLPYDQEMLEGMTKHIRGIGYSRKYFYTRKEALKDEFTEWAHIIMRADLFEKQLYDKLMDILGNDSEVLGKLFLLSFRLKMETEEMNKRLLIEAFMETALNSYLDANELYYVMIQGSQPLFTDANLRNRKISELSTALRTKVCDYYKGRIRTSFIQKEDRDESFVVVIIAQMLTMNHGPTKTALDRCFTLVRDHHKKVKLICTKELFSPSGEIPLFLPVIPNEMPEYDKTQSIMYKDLAIPFWQITGVMPRLDGAIQIMDYIRETKPYYIISIGGGIIPDLADGIVPVITIGTVPSGIPNADTTFKVIGRRLTHAEKTELEDKCVPAQSIIESIFTSGFKEQTQTFTRSKLGLPADRFLLLVVGGRLGQEVTEDFLQMFLRTIHANTHLVFMGHYPQYHNICKAIPELGRHSTYLGFMDEALAVNEVCDLYVNPLRTGGGTSAAEALFKGLPVVTIDFGDVGLGAGPDFCVSSYEDMKNAILRYAKDSGYYARMSQKAKDRAAYLMDSKTHFSHVIDQAVNSPLFR